MKRTKENGKNDIYVNTYNEQACRESECERMMPHAGRQFLVRQVSKKVIATS